MDTDQHTDLRVRFAWAFDEPDAAAIVASMKEDARRALAATTSPPGYRTAADPNDE
jgi:hypothetical protein